MNEDWNECFLKSCACFLYVFFMSHRLYCYSLSGMIDQLRGCGLTKTSRKDRLFNLYLEVVLVKQCC